MSPRKPDRPAAPREFLPFPFNELELPVTNQVLLDTLGPLLDQSAGLAATCFDAITSDCVDDQTEHVGQALEVLRQYLEMAVKIFDAWTQRDAPSSAEEGQA